MKGFSPQPLVLVRCHPQRAASPPKQEADLEMSFCSTTRGLCLVGGLLPCPPAPPRSSSASLQPPGTKHRGRALPPGTAGPGIWGQLLEMQLWLGKGSPQHSLRVLSPPQLPLLHPWSSPNPPPRSRGAARMSPQHQPDNQGAQSGVPAPLSPRCYPAVTPTPPGEAPAGRGPHRHPWGPRRGPAGPHRDPTDPSQAGDPPEPPAQPPRGLLPTPCLLPALGLATILLLLFLLLASSRQQSREPRPSASIPHLAPLSWQAGGRRGAQPTPAAGGAGARRI